MTRTVAALLDRAVAGRPDGEAIVMPGERLTFTELAARAHAFARRLRGAGLEPGDRVAVMHADCADSFALLLGAMRIGVVPVPVNGRYKARELAYVVGHSGARLLVVDRPRADLVAETDVDCRVATGLDDPAFVADGERVGDAEIDRLAAAVQPDDPAIILYTSGTTANPKGCVYAQRGFTAQAFSYAAAARLDETDRYWTPLPGFHVSAIVTIAACLAARATLVHVGGHFDPGVGLAQLEDERCTIAFPAFETVWLPVLNHPRFPEANLSALRRIINVGTPGSLRVMQEKLPSVPQISSFGGTEYGGFNAIGRPEDPLEKRLTTCGLPFPGVELRVVDPETGEDLPPETDGEILMRGEMRFVRYHDDPEQTALAIDADGWFHSGDLGRFDEEGRIAFRGRLKDMLKVGGENVAAAEVETYLLTHPDVEIAQVVSAPDARYTEVPAAFVQLRAGATVTEQELIDYCLGKIATFKVPRYVRFVDEWPMSGTKIQKFKLRERIAAELREAGITEAPKLRSPART
jgi:fatty-acyl-CoA synthase